MYGLCVGAIGVNGVIYSVPRNVPCKTLKGNICADISNDYTMQDHMLAYESHQYVAVQLILPAKDGLQCYNDAYIVVC